jgi:hypothetical protein
VARDDVSSGSSRVWLSVQPNPNRGTSALLFGLPSGGDATLRFFDVMGRELARREMPGLKPGTHLATWDGRDSCGGLLPSGIYWVRLEADSDYATRRWVLIR